jgi:alpha-L-fucosidase
MKIQLIAFLGIILFGAVVTLLAQEQGQEYYPEKDSLVLEKLEKWQELKFGLLMHWGPYCQWGVVESWSVCSEDEPWCRRKIDDYQEYKHQYENLRTTFNPVKFKPEDWAEAAKEAGMKYVVFTTKHHDGFCMFETKYSDYKVTDTDCPFNSDPRANVTKMIFNTFRDQGFWVGTYFSKPDWHSEYYWWPKFAAPDRNVNYDPADYPDRWEKFVQYTHNQIMELMTDYGQVDILWLDGGWVEKLSEKQIRDRYGDMLSKNPNGFIKRRVVSQDIRMGELVQKARGKQPGLIVVDREVEGPYQNYLTPENRVPEKMLPYPWEACLTSGGGWSWNPNARYKSPQQLVHILVDIVAKGGNLLLNIAPGPEGTWHDAAYDLLEDVGDWMEVNGEALYETRPLVPYKEGKVCLTQKKDGTVYAIYLTDENEVRPPKEISLTSWHPEGDAVVSLLGSDATINWAREDSGVRFHIPESLRESPPCAYAWAVKISSP